MGGEKGAWIYVLSCPVHDSIARSADDGYVLAF